MRAIVPDENIPAVAWHRAQEKVSCPNCHARPGQHCMDSNARAYANETTFDLHGGRIFAAMGALEYEQRVREALSDLLDTT